jgi:outer membrane protein TolC
MQKHYSKILFASLMLCACISISRAQTPGTLTIEYCQEHARNNYPLIKQFDLIDKSATYSISNANKAYLPQVSITAIEGYIINGLPSMVPGVPSENGSFKFIGIGQINQTIWDGGGTHVQKDMIKSSVEVEKANIEVSLYTIRERVNQLFFGLLAINEQLKQLDIQKQNLQRNLNKVKQSVDNGLGYTSDSDEVRVELLKIDQHADEFIYTRKSYIAMLALMIGEKLLEDIQLVKPVNSETALPSVINRPELSLYNYQRQLVEMQNKQSKASYMPKIGLLGLGVRLEPGASFGISTLQSLSIAGLNLSWNTSGLYRDKNTREQTTINLEKIQNQQETFLFNTNLQLVQQSNEIEKQNSILAKDTEIMNLRTSIKKSYEIKYQNGVCSVNDLILAVNAESEAGSNKILHEIQLMLSIFNYKTTSGN